jgi:DNA-directed RNA polymerase specialized sigma24 family protein
LLPWLRTLAFREAIDVVRREKRRAERERVFVEREAGSAFEEWSDAKLGMKGGSILDAVRFYNAHHLGLPTKLFKDVADEFTAAKEAAGISHAYPVQLRSATEECRAWCKHRFVS